MKKQKQKKNAINEEKNPEISSVGYIHPHFVLGSIDTRNIEDIYISDISRYFKLWS